MSVLLVMAMLAQPVLSLTTLAKSDVCGVEQAAQAVVRTAEEWSPWWKTHAPERPQPAVDFSQHMVLAVFLGSRPTSGYSVEVRRVLPGPDAVTVEYAERQPGPQSVTAQILTAPCHIVSVARQPGGVRFLKVEAPSRE